MAATFRALVPWVKLSQHFILHPIDEDLSLGARIVGDPGAGILSRAPCREL